MTLQQIKGKIGTVRAEISKIEGRREQMQLQLHTLENEINSLEEDSILAQQGSYILKNFILDRRANATDSIANIGTKGVQMIYSDDYGLEFHTFDEKRKEGSNAGFKMELLARSEFGDNDFVVTEILDARGGGFSESSSVALRLGAIDWMKYKGPVFFDETWSSISNDSKLYSIAQFIFTYCKVTGRQIIFATHDYHVFGKEAKNIVKIDKKKGVASAQNITYDEAMELRESENGTE